MFIKVALGVVTSDVVINYIVRTYETSDEHVAFVTEMKSAQDQYLGEDKLDKIDDYVLYVNRKNKINAYKIKVSQDLMLYKAHKLPLSPNTLKDRFRKDVIEPD
jgi:hypothetical protein